MKAISLWEPWAALCVLAAKQFETRHWPTAHRGPILIHAASLRDGVVMDAISELEPILRSYGMTPADLRFGALIGRVTLVDCQRMRDIQPPSDQERAVGNWSPDRYAWKLENPVMFPKAIRYRGSQGLFNVNTELYQVPGGEPEEFDPRQPKVTKSIP